MDRTIITTLEQMRSFDYVQGNHDTLLGLGSLAQDVLSQLGLSATAQTVVAGMAATQTSPASLSINIGAGRIYTLAQADATSGGAISADTTTVCQQGQLAVTLQGSGAGSFLAQVLTLVPPSAGQSQWNLIQCQYQQADAIRTNDPTSGIVPFYNSSNPSVPNPTTVNTVRQARCVLQVVTGAAATTGSEVPPLPTSNWTPLYLIDLAGGQSSITTAQVLTAGPSIGTGVPSNYPVAPFLAGFLASHHSGNAGQAPKIRLASEVQGVLPYANMSPVRTLLGASLTLYVNSTTGNDSNPGTSPSLAYQTIQAAVNSAYRNYDFNGNACTISVANGAYNVTNPPSGAGVVFNGLPVGMPTASMLLIGNVGSPGSVTLAVTSGNGIVGQNATWVQISGITVTATGSFNSPLSPAGYGIASTTGSLVATSTCVLGACGGAQLRAQTGGTLVVNGPITVTGATPVSLSSDQGLVWTVGQTCTVSGTVDSVSFAAATNCGILTANGMTFVGTATGPRFTVANNGVINTAGGGANYFPGTVVGAQTTGGQYT